MQRLLHFESNMKMIRRTNGISYNVMKAYFKVLCLPKGIDIAVENEVHLFKSLVE